MNEIDLSETNGLRRIIGMAVDKAGIDQNRNESENDSMAVRLARKDLSHINQPSLKRWFELRVNPKEVSVYPNPFNPSGDDAYALKAKLVFHLEKETDVKITILDPFGQLIYSREARGKEGLNDGHFDDNFCWDGRNGKGEVVGNGGYICVIDPVGGERQIRKIAVLKSN